MSTTTPPAAEVIPGIIDEIYAGFMTRDTDSMDKHFFEDISIWIPSEFPLVDGIAGLNGVRARRPVDGDVNRAVKIDVPEITIDQHGDVAWVRHVIVVHYPDGEADVMRCTSVWQAVDGRWLERHSHEDLLPAGTTYPFPDPTA